MASLVLIKPDALENKLIGTLVSWFEFFGIENMKIVRMDRELCRQHYAAHIHKDFYPELEKFMVSLPVLALEVYTDDYRNSSNWDEDPGVERVRETAMRIRKYYKHLVKGPRNLVHASDSVTAAEREVKLWFAT